MYAIGLVLATTLVHTGCTIAVIGWFRSRSKHQWALRSNLTRALVLACVVLGMALAAYLESFLWALLYWAVEALPTLADAAYFSLVTFTTLGYGDITLEEQWRMLGAFESTNGIIFFGWTTAIIVSTVQRLFVRDPADLEGS